MNLLDRVIEHEGFRAKPYQDSLGIWTFGHGLTWISESESRAIVEGRLKANRESLMTIMPWLADQPPAVVEVLVEMSYQLGVRGVNQFTKMLGHIQRKEYGFAATEGLDSKWARQTPERAHALMTIIRDHHNGA